MGHAVETSRVDRGSSSGASERDIAAVEASFRCLLLTLGIDRQLAADTQSPRRAAEAWLKMLGGRTESIESLFDGLIDDAHTGQLISVVDLPFRSVCEHHLLPFDGLADIHIAPDARLIGLGRIATLVDTLSRRLQLQERLGAQIAETLHAGVAARGVLVRLTAVHGCLAHVEPRAARSPVISVAYVGDIDAHVMTSALQRVPRKDF